MKQPVFILAQSEVSQRPWDGATVRSGSATACQHDADTKALKAFTGRGRAGQGDLCWLEASLVRVHAEMAELARASKTVRGRSFYLSVHRRATSGQQSLRWRSMGTNRHLPWTSMPALFALQLAPIDAFRDGRYLWLEGEIRTSEFLGEVVRYQVAVGTLSISVNQAHFNCSPVTPSGTAVLVGFDPSRARLFPASAFPVGDKD